MMKKHSTASKGLRRKIVVGFLGATICGLLPATAFAATSSGGGATTNSTAPESHPQCTSTNFPVAKVYVESLVKQRVVTLDVLNAAVSRASDLTASDKAQLQSNLSNDLAGMQTLEQQVPSDTTCQELVANAETMVFDYRVYLVMTPQAWLVIVSDSETAIASKAVSWEPGIQAAITYAADHGKDVTSAQQAFLDLKTQLSNVLATLQGVSSTVLAQTPAGSPGNHVVFVDARTKCQTAFSDLRDARLDIAAIMSVL